MNRMKNNRLSCLVLLLLMAGCSTATVSMAPITISSIRPGPIGIETVTSAISKDEISRALETGRGSSNVRVVPLVTSAAQAPASAEYRVFNVRPGSVAALIGLKNADILVAAHDYVIQSPQQFYNYLQLLRAQEKSSIELRRDGKPLRIEFTIQ
jgi:S1-C subfamily serine protease